MNHQFTMEELMADGYFPGKMARMPRVLVVHWNAPEAAERAQRLRDQGFEAESYAGPGGAAFLALAAAPPGAIVIDLARIPSQGGAAGIAFRQRKATRLVPLVFIEGDPEKTAHVRAMLPDAIFTTWTKIGAALRRALRQAPRQPLVPDTFARYSGTQNCAGRCAGFGPGPPASLSCRIRSPATPARPSPRNFAFGRTRWRPCSMRRKGSTDRKSVV